MAGNNIVDNNVSLPTLGTVAVGIIDSNPLQTKFIYPQFTGIYFCSDDQDYGTQTFAIGDANNGAKFIQAGTFSLGLDNFQIITKGASPEAFSVYDTTTKALFAIAGDGTVTMNAGDKVFDAYGRIARTAAAPPTVAVNANAGTGATAVITAGGSDNAFQLSITSGTAAITFGVWAHVTFAHPFAKAPIVVFSPNGAYNPNWFLPNALAINITANGFDFYVGNNGGAVPPASNNGVINFIVIG